MRTYINGILYSVLEHPHMREAAKRRGMPDLLLAVSATSPEMFAGQIQHILARVGYRVGGWV